MSVMDPKLVAWARSVKSRRRHDRTAPPPLWLFTDAARMPDPLPFIANLPKGLAGVVFRHDAAANRADLARAAARICRARRLTLVIADDARLAWSLGVGNHLRGGHRQFRSLPHRLVTGSAHGVAELQRGTRARVALVFVSPIFATMSHHGAAGLGVVRWCLLVRRLSGRRFGFAAALGGIDGGSARRLPRDLCDAAGAIGAFVA